MTKYVDAKQSFLAYEWDTRLGATAHTADILARDLDSYNSAFSQKLSVEDKKALQEAASALRSVSINVGRVDRHYAPSKSY